jgi:hypothetical protein
MTFSVRIKAKKLNNIKECKDSFVRNKFTTEFNVYDTPTHITFHIIEATERKERVKRYKDWISTLDIPNIAKESHCKELDEWLNLCDEYMCDVEFYWM